MTTSRKRPARKPVAEPRPGPSADRKRGSFTFIEEARRRQILDAALTLFAERGYDRTSLTDLAAAIGVSKGVVSYHFHGKAELGREALRHLIRRYRDFVRERLDAKATARERLLELPIACIDFVQQQPLPYLVYLDTLGSFGTATDAWMRSASGPGAKRATEPSACAARISSVSRWRMPAMARAMNSWRSVAVPKLPSVSR